MKNNLYIEVLVWAYNRQEDGFQRKELYEKFDLKGDKASWVEENFFYGTPDTRPLIGSLPSNKGTDYFALSARGMSEAVNYLGLDEARVGGKKALRVAICSIVITGIISLIQFISCY